MAKVERVRELLSTLPGSEYFDQRVEKGWRLLAVEWERPAEEDAESTREEVPYGFRVSDDCLHIEEHPEERKVLRALLDLMVEDRSLSQAADHLNQMGFTNRQGHPWTQTSLFKLLPRLIEFTPRVPPSPRWTGRGQEVEVG